MMSVFWLTEVNCIGSQVLQLLHAVSVYQTYFIYINFTCM